MAAKSSRKRASEANPYDSDHGFVEDAPKNKKSKSSTGNEMKARDGKSTVATGTQKDEEGNAYWEISRTRRVQISEFKGTTMVGIREFYEKDGKSLPGKKGISLSIDQYASLLKNLPAIEKILNEQGHSVPRPKYDDGAIAEVEHNEAKDEQDAGQQEHGVEEEGDAHTANGRLDKYNMDRKNHEATSDEDE